MERVSKRNACDFLKLSHFPDIKEEAQRGAGIPLVPHSFETSGRRIAFLQSKDRTNPENAPQTSDFNSLVF